MSAAVKANAKTHNFGKPWPTEKLGNHVVIRSGDSPSLMEFSRSGMPYYKVEQLGNANKYLNADCTPYFFAPGKSISSGSVVFAKRGAAIALNRIRIFSQDSFIDTNLMALTPGKGILSEYIYYYLSKVGLWSIADTASIPQINNKHILPLELPLPTVEEQHAIVEALSEIDGLIEALGALVAKKRAIREGAMQALFKPTEKWVEHRLGNSSQIKARIGWQGLTTAEYRESGDCYLVTGTEFDAGAVEWSRCYFVDQHRYDQDRYIQLRAGDVLVTKDGTIGKVAYISDLPGNATLNSGVFVIRPMGNSYAPKFLYYVLKSDMFLDFLKRLSAGSTINHLYQKDFVTFSFRAPPTSEEQNEIADVLFDIDREIAIFESRLSKVRQIKSAMMDELLSGRVRFA